MRLSRKMWITACLILALVDSPAWTQQKSANTTRLVVVTRLTSTPGSAVAKLLASTITSSINLTLGMTGTIAVQRANFLAPTAFLGRSIDYYRQVNADGAVYGSVSSQKDGSYRIELDIWNSAKQGAKPETIGRTINNVLTLFGLADVLSLKVASTVVGKTLSEGSLEIRNLGSLQKYAVYADGHLLGRDRSSFHVLTGKREIVVAKPGILGDIPIKVFHVRITKDRATIVSLRAPAKPTPVSTVAKKSSLSPGTARASGQATAQQTENKRPPAKGHHLTSHLQMGLLQIRDTSKVAALGHFTISSESGKRKIDISSGQTESLHLVPGTYRVGASLGDDPGIDYKTTVKVLPGKTTNLQVSLVYTRRFETSRLTAERNSYSAQLAKVEKAQAIYRKWGHTAVTSGSAAALAAAISYFLGRSSYASYESATSTATASQYRSQLLTFGGIAVGTGGVGIGLLTLGAIVLGVHSSSNKLKRLQNSIDTLNQQIRALNRSKSSGN